MASDSDDSVERLKPYVDRPIVDFADFVRDQEDLAKRVKAFKKSRKKLVETQQAIEALSVEMDSAVKTASEAIKDIEEINENILRAMDKNLREKLEKEMVMLRQKHQTQNRQEMKKEEEKEQGDQEEVDEPKEQKQGDLEIGKMDNEEQEEEKDETRVKERQKEKEEKNHPVETTSQKSEKKSAKKSRSKK